MVKFDCIMFRCEKIFNSPCIVLVMMISIYLSIINKYEYFMWPIFFNCI
jgi:hypothetical protein